MEKVLGHDMDKIYMVHVTKYFPKNHKILSTYDGNKIYYENSLGEPIKVYLDDTEKNVHVPSHRHTVHFTLNTVVENTKDGLGNWDGIPMAILEPMITHQKQFLTYGQGDSYTWGSVDLSSEATIIIKKEHLDLIPEEERKNWNIIVCNGEISRAVKDFFKERNLPTFPYEDLAGHQMSEEYLLEDNLQRRDKAINYVKNNSFDGKSDIELSMEEFRQIIRIYRNPQNRMNIHSRVGIENLIAMLDKKENFSIFRNQDDNSSRILEAIIGSGFSINENGTVSLKSDETIYDFLSKPQDTVEQTMQEIRDIYVKYIEFLCSKPQETRKGFEQEVVQQMVENLRSRKTEELTDTERNIIDLDNKRILSKRIGELTEEERNIAKGMRPKSKETSDASYIEVLYGVNGITTVGIGNDIPSKNEAIMRKFQNIAGAKVDTALENCIVNLDGIQENETISEYYARVQGVIDAFSEIAETGEQVGENFEFSNRGVTDKRKRENLLVSAIEATCATTTITRNK